MRCHPMLIPCLLIAGAVSMVMVGGQRGEAEYTADFGIDSADTFLPSGGNPFVSLNPGSVLRLEGEDDGQFIQIEIAVLRQARQVHFEAHGVSMTAKTRVVEEREWIDGELAQVSLHYLAFSPKSGNVYNFGVDVTHYEDGEIVSHDDSWMAGENGAQPGLLLPGFFLLGSRYCRELAPGVSMDRAENVAMGLTVRTPAGVFRNCVTVLETTPLEPDEEVLKVYAPGVGLIVDGALELVEFHP